jgi:hypothetical protein
LVTYQPVTKLIIRPGAVDSVGSTIIVLLELLGELVTVLFIVGLDDAMINEPLVLKSENKLHTPTQEHVKCYHVGSTPSTVNRVRNRAISSAHLSQELFTSELGLGLHNAMFL